VAHALHRTLCSVCCIPFTKWNFPCSAFGSVGCQRCRANSNGDSDVTRRTASGSSAATNDEDVALDVMEAMAARSVIRKVRTMSRPSCLGCASSARSGRRRASQRRSQGSRVEALEPIRNTPYRHMSLILRSNFVFCVPRRCRLLFSNAFGLWRAQQHTAHSTSPAAIRTHTRSTRQRGQRIRRTPCAPGLPARCGHWSHCQPPALVALLLLLLLPPVACLACGIQGGPANTTNTQRCRAYRWR
jgi:hypothetical protein